MIRTMLKGKIHRATVTEADVDYEGSITIDSGLMEAAGILPHEQVHVLDVTNGARLTTYAVAGGPGEICINGAAARLVEVQDTVIILSYAGLQAAELEAFESRIVHVDKDNRIVEVIVSNPTAGWVPAGASKLIPDNPGKEPEPDGRR